ncbi:P-loop containing nucleoside triphosphate hydrolase protein [Auricularia subglabra TFB-10046 SS5]|nr:P-loop containing nucleoside triphosphate hydrolase protein [Auricularia subglabra TFB-10046 SS5]
MALSVRQTSAALPILRGLLAEWKQERVSDTDLDDFGPIEDKDVIVAFRTRPPLEGETAVFDPSQVADEQDEDSTPEAPTAEFLAGVTVTSARPGVMYTHVPSSSWKGHAFAHKAFQADLCFDANTSNDDVYGRSIVDTKMLELALNGGVACVLAYGQTSTGKTYTIEALEHRIARDLFPLAERLGDTFKQAHGDKSDAPVFEFTVTFLELLGKIAVDLASGNDEGQRTRVDIMEDKLGAVRPLLDATTVTNPEELEALITQCLAHRRTSPTHRNSRSSRSHAILSITVRNRLMRHLEDGQILLVDLAGSERYTDAKLHSRERLDENKETNKSLMALKDCVQARARAAESGAFVHIPYRGNKLTLLLKALFDLDSRQPTRTLVIAHVSPHVQDAAHSANTLSYAAPFRSAAPAYQPTTTVDEKDPRTWDHAFAVSWLERGLRVELAKVLPGKKAPDVLPVDLARFLPAPLGGLQLCKMYGAEWVRSMLAARVDGATVSSDRMEKAAFSVYVVLSERLRLARTAGKRDVFKSGGGRESYHDRMRQFSDRPAQG